MGYGKIKSGRRIEKKTLYASYTRKGRKQNQETIEE